MYENKILHNSIIKNILFISLYLYKVYVKKGGNYILRKAIDNVNSSNQPPNNYIHCMAVSPTSGKRRLYGSYGNSGEIILTRWDDDGLILSGTFCGKLKEIDGEEIIEIKDGRFDINSKNL